MSTVLRYPKGYQFFDANGKPLSDGNLYYYVANTTTPQDTYSNSTGTIVNANPIVLDGSGRLGVDVYLGSAADYKEVLTTSSSIISPWPDDNISRAVSIVVFTGDSGSGGASGLVPAPAAGDALANKFLKADGTWALTPGGSASSATNLSVAETAATVTLASSTGSGATIPAATASLAGVLDSVRAAKIDGLATVAVSGSYTDLSNTPTIPAAQVNSDWNASSGLSQILNKPSTLTPSAHAATHAATGSDAISISASQVSGLATAGTALPLMDGVASAGTSTSFSCADHVHPTDTSRAPLASPAFTGNPTAPTLAAGNNSTTLATTAYLDRQLGTAGGIATLDSSGKLASTQIPASLLGAVVYQGTWNASTNTPAITGGVGAKGNYYKVSVAGSTAIDGVSQWNVGDTIIFDGTAWDKIDGITNEVVSVAGLYGAISATALKAALTIAASDVSGLAAVAISGAYSSLSGTPSAFTGDSGSGGTTGLVPAPAAGSASSGAFLKADGTWSVPSPASGMSNPMTAAGDLIYGSAGGTPTRLGIGAQGAVLFTGAGAPAWLAPASAGNPLISGGASANPFWATPAVFANSGNLLGLTAQNVTDVALSITGKSGQTAPLVQITSAGATPDTLGQISINNADPYHAIWIRQTNTTGDWRAIDILAPGATTSLGQLVSDTPNLTTGGNLWVGTGSPNFSNTATGVGYIAVLNAAATGTALYVRNAGTGIVCKLHADQNNQLMAIEGSAITTSYAFNGSFSGLTTGAAIYMYTGSSAFKGGLIYSAIGNSSATGTCFYATQNGSASAVGYYAMASLGYCADFCSSTTGTTPVARCWTTGATPPEALRLMGYNAGSAGRPALTIYSGGSSTLGGNWFYSGELGLGMTGATTRWLAIAAGTTAKSQINFAASTAPTTPNNGDLWFDGASFKCQIGGVTKTFTVA